MATDNSQILIIDDDDMVADAMSRALSLVGYEITRSKDGESGLKEALEKHPGLIVLDYKMPDMDGIDVLHGLRNDMWGHSAKVIFATNVYDVDAVNEVMRFGVTDYVMKSDLAISDFLRLVAKYIPPPPSPSDGAGVKPK